MSAHDSITISGNTLRARILDDIKRGVITSQTAEVLMSHVQSLETLARAGITGTAMGAALADPEPTWAPKSTTAPIGSTRWSKAEHFAREGKPPPRESKTERDARERAESIGMEGGRYTGRKPGGSGA